MSCCGKHKRVQTTGAKKRPQDYFIGPMEPCVLCAEKHIATANALAGEAGYVAINRQRIIGELTCAALHLFKDNKETAERVRAVRHLIQHRREAEVNWNHCLTEIDMLATAEAAQETPE